MVHASVFAISTLAIQGKSARTLSWRVSSRCSVYRPCHFSFVDVEILRKSKYACEEEHNVASHI